MAGLSGIDRLVAVSLIKAEMEQQQQGSVSDDEIVIALLYSIDQRLKELNERLAAQTPR